MGEDRKSERLTRVTRHRKIWTKGNFRFIGLKGRRPKFLGTPALHDFVTLTRKSSGINPTSLRLELSPNDPTELQKNMFRMNRIVFKKSLDVQFSFLLSKTVLPERTCHSNDLFWLDFKMMISMLGLILKVLASLLASMLSRHREQNREWTHWWVVCCTCSWISIIHDLEEN